MIYSVIAFVAIIIHLIVNRDVLTRKLASEDIKAKAAYRYFCYGILLYHITDVLWGICDASGSQILLYIDTIIYYLAMYLAVMLWAEYVIKYLHDDKFFSKVLSLVVRILMVVEFIVLIANHFNHFFFWVDKEGHYHAYTFRYIALTVQIILFLITAGYAFIKINKAPSESLKNRYKAIGAFGIAMGAAIMIQFFYPLLPIYSIGYMIGICIIHSFIIEDENAELRRKADEANKAKTSFLFNMSHDIRTPMNAILGYTDIGLAQTSEADASKGLFEKIKVSGVHLLSLLNDILEMSRIESGHLALTVSPSDIRALVDGVKYMSNSLAVSKCIDFDAAAENITDPYIYCDELHINEVMINLVSNAIKYTEKGGNVRYHVEQLSPAENGKAIYRFVIADNGIGMSEEFLSKLFEPFSREKSTTVSKIEGTGLGLSIVKKIVDLAEGTITVQSTLGKGSTFTVDLPFKVMDEKAISEYIDSKNRSNAATAIDMLKGKKVLMAEDNEMNREIAEYILNDAGIDVDCAEDGQMALDILDKNGINNYDFILMDIQMPVMDGYHATKAIREKYPESNIPIIALSANAFAEDKAASRAAGMDGHVVKPINVDELFKVVSELVNK